MDEGLCWAVPALKSEDASGWPPRTGLQLDCWFHERYARTAYFISKDCTKPWNPEIKNQVQDK